MTFIAQTGNAAAAAIASILAVQARVRQLTLGAGDAQQALHGVQLRFTLSK
jgi:hypothetical protein